MKKPEKSVTGPSATLSVHAVGVAERVAALLERFGTARLWRLVAASLVAFLVTAAAQGGLVVFVPAIQIGILAGLAAGLVASDRVTAAAGAAMGACLAGLIGPQNAWVPVEALGDRVILTAVSAALGAATAALARRIVGRRLVAPQVLMWAAVALMVANLWATTLSSNAQATFDPLTQSRTPSFNDQLSGQVPEALAGSDDAWFLKIHTELRDGMGYYEAMRGALVDNPQWAAASPINFRLPTLFWLLALVPPHGLPVAFLVLASCAVIATPFISAGVVRMPVALVACASLAAYFVYFPVQLTLLSQEQWAACVALLSCAAYATALRRNHRPAWTVVAVVLAVFAAAIRETAVFVPLAGLASALLAPKAERPFEVAAWGGGLAVFAGIYAAHWALTTPLLEPSTSFASTGGGSLAFALAALDYATDMLGSGGSWPYVVAVLGLVGIALVPEVRTRVFGAVAGVMPLVIFVFVSNRAWYQSTGVATNYWGATVMPIVYAFVPFAMLVLPGLSSSTSSRVRASRRAKPSGRRTE